jgi:hypothetical protein
MEHLHSSTVVLEARAAVTAVMVARLGEGTAGAGPPRFAVVPTRSFLLLRGERWLLSFGITLLFSGCPQARADPQVEISGATGFGVLAAGVTSGRFAISPSASLSIRGERGFFVARSTVSFLGATGGRFGINNETTLGGGLFWELVNVSAGLLLAAYSLPICGPRLCGQTHGLAPGGSVRLDLFGPYLEGGLGVSVDCAGTWITGSAAPVWSGVSVRCSAGPILRFASRH